MILITKHFFVESTSEELYSSISSWQRKLHQNLGPSIFVIFLDRSNDSSNIISLYMQATISIGYITCVATKE